jgi:hypothetical protein
MRFLRVLLFVIACLAPAAVYAGSGTGAGNALPSNIPHTFGIGPAILSQLDTNWISNTGILFTYYWMYVVPG